jgi:hypothetical protein
MNLRKEACGRDCMIRLPGICTNDSSTVVLAHVRLIGVSGMGMKSPDLLGAWACSACHDVVDRRVKTNIDIGEIRLAHLEGMVRTINQLVKEDKI